MFESFEKLSKDKKKKILDASIEEFAKHGYQKASTNTIVEKADISKGILFHYFGNKKKLFLYTVDYVLNYLQEISNPYRKDVTTTDLFDRIKELGIVKFKIVTEEPIMSEFMAKVFISIPKEIEKEMNGLTIKVYKRNMELLVKDIDTSKFRKDVDINKVIEILMLIRDGIGKKYLEAYKGKEIDILNKEQYDGIVREFDQYFDILKWGCYREMGK